MLAQASPDQWAEPSLCDGWRVREVVAHITMSYRISMPRFLFGLARSGFKFNSYSDQQARADATRLTDAQLLASLQDNIEHPWRPPGGGQVGALSHDVIHGFDITEPLGWPAAPPERIKLVLEHAGKKNLAFFGTDLTGKRLIADDVDLTLGDGPREIRMTAREMLLAVTGRAPLPS
ncbi:maleylpyruvate isomerase family mycothiol-dependent enzyme [Antrihabitans cavernicola]|uniref:maleylpyruvate isomerase family mycothiol-dependent enzyme n=1 Tax=Antrihabitans cavernicola TaxID=2495913 RepID=UPI001F3DAA1B|nr:maleylpyruvate isomerase family mycothiol-dependent enzyme [Spelaeibacter cavernicola]